MKKHLLAFLLAASRLALAETSLLGIDSFAVGKNAGYNGSANRSVFIGPGAGAYIGNADSNVVIGAAAALDGNYINSSIAFGHYAMRGATYLDDIIAIGDQTAKSASSTWNSVFIGKNTANGSYGLYNDIFIGNEIGKGVNNVHDSITIGHNLTPANNTVNIGGRIVCDANGLKINGTTFNSANSTAFNTIPFRTDDEEFISYLYTSPNGYHTYSESDPDWYVTTRIRIIDLRVTAKRSAGVSQGWDSFSIDWAIDATGGNRNHHVVIQNSHFNSFTPNTFSDSWETYAIGPNVNDWAFKDSYTITVTSSKITIVIKQTRQSYTASSYYRTGPETTKTFTFNYSSLPSSGTWKEFDRTVDTVADITHDTRLITSAGVARSISNRVQNCSIKYESGALKVYDLNGTLLGTLNL